MDSQSGIRARIARAFGVAPSPHDAVVPAGLTRGTPLAERVQQFFGRIHGRSAALVASAEPTRRAPLDQRVRQFFGRIDRRSAALVPEPNGARVESGELPPFPSDGDDMVTATRVGNLAHAIAPRQPLTQTPLVELQWKPQPNTPAPSSIDIPRTGSVYTFGGIRRHDNALEIFRGMSRSSDDDGDFGDMTESYFVANENVENFIKQAVAKFGGQPPSAEWLPSYLQCVCSQNKGDASDLMNWMQNEKIDFSKKAKVALHQWD